MLFFYMMLDGDLGGRMDPELGCTVHCVVVETTEACWDMRLASGAADATLVGGATRLLDRALS